MKTRNEDDGSSASLGAIPSGVINVVNPVEKKRGKLKKKHSKLPKELTEADDLDWLNNAFGDQSEPSAPKEYTPAEKLYKFFQDLQVGDVIRVGKAKFQLARRHKDDGYFGPFAKVGTTGKIWYKADPQNDLTVRMAPTSSLYDKSPVVVGHPIKLSEAMQIIQAMNELVKVQIPMITHEEDCWLKGLCNAGDKLQRKIPMVTVKVAELIPTQWRISQSNINRLVREGIFNGGLVIKRKDPLTGVVGMYIADGHHRALAAKKAGKETCRVRLIELGETPVSLSTIAKRFDIDKDELVASLDSQNRIEFEKQP